jgi:hypothetical protein
MHFVIENADTLVHESCKQENDENSDEIINIMQLKSSKDDNILDTNENIESNIQISIDFVTHDSNDQNDNTERNQNQSNNDFESINISDNSIENSNLEILNENNKTENLQSPVTLMELSISVDNKYCKPNLSPIIEEDIQSSSTQLNLHETENIESCTENMDVYEISQIFEESHSTCYIKPTTSEMQSLISPSIVMNLNHMLEKPTGMNTIQLFIAHY